jgi:hypothetical protein
MKFTLGMLMLVKMVRQVGKNMPCQKWVDPTLGLYACAAWSPRQTGTCQRSNFLI